MATIDAAFEKAIDGVVEAQSPQDALAWAKTVTELYPVYEALIILAGFEYNDEGDIDVPGDTGNESQ